MKEVATITFRDLETHDEAIAVVRQDDRSVALCLAVHRVADVEVVMSKDDARKLLEALRVAVT